MRGAEVVLDVEVRDDRHAGEAARRAGRARSRQRACACAARRLARAAAAGRAAARRRRRYVRDDVDDVRPRSPPRDALRRTARAAATTKTTPSPRAAGRARELQRDELAAGDVAADHEVRDPSRRGRRRRARSRRRRRRGRSRRPPADDVCHRRRPVTSLGRACAGTAARRAQAEHVEPLQRAVARRLQPSLAVTARPRPNARRSSASKSSAANSRSWNGFSGRVVVSVRPRRRDDEHAVGAQHAREPRRRSAPGRGRCSIVSNEQTTSNERVVELRARAGRRPRNSTFGPA